MAFNHTYHTDFYEVDEDNKYTKLDHSSKLNKLLKREEDWYIIGTGERL